MLKRTSLRFGVLLLAVIAQLFACAGGTGTTTGNVNPPSNGNDSTAPMESDMTVSKHSLTVAKSGGGKVTSDPVGIDCGTACAMDAHQE